MTVRLLIAAPCELPRAEGVQLLAAARRLGHDAHLFDRPASRDPTLELPALAWRLRPRVVVLVGPDREDPDTLDLLRRAGATVVVWAAPLPLGAATWQHARLCWIAAAADVVAATVPSVAARLRDRHGRPAVVVAGGFDLATLGGGAAHGEGADAAACVAVRAADDPLRVRPAAGRALLGYGPRAAFPDGGFAAVLPRVDAFAGRVRGRTYVGGGRATDGAPSVFDDVAAARALGCPIVHVAVHGTLAGAVPEPAAPVAVDFGGRLETLLTSSWSEAIRA